MEHTSCNCCTTHSALTCYQLHRVILRVGRGPLVILDQRMVRNSFKTHIDPVSVLQWCGQARCLSLSKNLFGSLAYVCCVCLMLWYGFITRRRWLSCSTCYCRYYFGRYYSLDPRSSSFSSLTARRQEVHVGWLRS